MEGLKERNTYTQTQQFSLLTQLHDSAK